MPQSPEAIALFTFDEKICSYNIAQGLMRFRQFITTQNAYVTLTADSRSTIYNQGATADDLIIHSRIQLFKTRTTVHMERHFKQQIDNIPDQHLYDVQIDMALKCERNEIKIEELIEFIRETKELVVLEGKYDPFEMFGHLKQNIDTKEHLIGS